jgi:hypothetical protein
MMRQWIWPGAIALLVVAGLLGALNEARGLALVLCCAAAAAPLLALLILFRRTDTAEVAEISPRRQSGPPV